MTEPGFLDIISFGWDGWGPALAAGAWMTILIAIAGFAIGGVIGIFGAWAKISGSPFLRGCAEA